MKYTLLLAAAALAAALSSCVGTGPSAAPVAKCGSCSSAAPAVAKAKTSCSPNLAGMAPTCAGSCSTGDCTCVKHPCRCTIRKPAVVKVAVSKPAPKPAVVVLETTPAPPPPVIPSYEKTVFGEYREYSGQVHQLVVNPGEAVPEGNLLFGPQDRTIVTTRTYKVTGTAK